MALFYPKFFEPVVLTAVAQTLYTVPSGIARGVVLRFTNTTAGLVTVTTYAVPSGGSASSANTVVLAKAIAPNDFYDLIIPTLKAGDFIQALASAGASVTAHFLQGVIQA
jgi:hypothetical protein